MTFSGTQWQWLRGGEYSLNSDTTMRPLPRSRPASPLSQWFPSHSPSTNLAAARRTSMVSTQKIGTSMKLASTTAQLCLEVVGCKKWHRELLMQGRGTW